MLPKESAKFIFSNSENVSINKDKVDELCTALSLEFLNDKSALNSWKQNELNPKHMDAKAIAWIFFVDTINFSFWPDECQSKFTVNYKSKSYTGYWSICAAINRALDMGIDVTDAIFMKQITNEKFNKIFYSENREVLPLVSERVAILNDTGSVLIEKFEGHFINCIKMANKSAQNLLQIIVDNFTSYRDQCLYKNELVCLYKRAQILIADCWSCFENQGCGEFYDIDSLTAFADYRVPQVLAYFKAIEYSPELMDYLESKKLLANGDPREVEIRGVTLQCIEIMVTKIREKLDNADIHINSILVDNFLWNYRRTKEESIDSVPMHRTRTIYY